MPMIAAKPATADAATTNGRWDRAECKAASAISRTASAIIRSVHDEKAERSSLTMIIRSCRRRLSLALPVWPVISRFSLCRCSSCTIPGVMRSTETLIVFRITSCMDHGVSAMPAGMTAAGSAMPNSTASRFALVSTFSAVPIVAADARGDRAGLQRDCRLPQRGRRRINHPDSTGRTPIYKIYERIGMLI